MKNNYIIPYGERFVDMANSFLGGWTLMCVDNLGLVVRHDPKIVPTDDNVRRHLVGWKTHNTTLVQAESLQDALKKFYDFEECRTGTKHRAWELVDSKDNPIIEYSGCEFMRNREDGCIACACGDEPEDDHYVMCILDGCNEPPRECPIDAQMGNNGWRSEVVQVGGVWVKRYSRFVKTESVGKLVKSL